MQAERRLRVLLTTSTFPVRADDGTPRFVLDLAVALSEHADVTVVAPSAPGAAERERVGRVEVRRFTYFRPSRYQRLAMGEGIPDNLRRSALAWIQVPGFFASEFAAMRRIARERQIDVVNPHWLVPQGLIAAAAFGGASGVPIVAQAHGGDAHLLRDLPLGRAVAAFVVRRVRILLASGSGVRSILNDLLGRDLGVRLQPMGVNTAVFGRGPEVGDGAVDPAVDATFPEGFLLAVCRMIELKGLHYLVRALPKIRAEQPALGLVLIGDGPERPRLEEEVGRLGLADAVRFVGRLPHGTVAAYVRQCRVAVVPSIVDATGRTDGMPTVIPEAMAAGARVVASRVGGIPDVVRHGENGWLARERDPDDLARQILLALDDGPESSVVREARETARQLDWRQVAENYLGYFEEALCEAA